MASGISQKALAVALGKGERQATISSWEQEPGCCPVYAVDVDSLQVVFGIDPRHWEDPAARRERLARLQRLARSMK